MAIIDQISFIDLNFEKEICNEIYSRSLNSFFYYCYILMTKLLLLERAWLSTFSSNVLNYFYWTGRDLAHSVAMCWITFTGQGMT